MKNLFSSRPALTSLAVAALLCSGLASPIQAQPAPMQAGQDKPRRERRAGVPRRVLTALEAKTGQPVSPATRAKLTAIAKVRAEAVKEAQEKYLTDFAAATGLTLEEAREMNRPARRDAQGEGAMEGGKRPRRRGGRRGQGQAEAPVPAPR